MQGRYRDLWQDTVRRAFEQIDRDGSGFIEREELVAYLADRLSPYEVRAMQHCCWEPAVLLFSGFYCFYLKLSKVTSALARTDRYHWSR